MNRAERIAKQTAEVAKLKADLAQEYGLEGHPKLNLLFNKAWDLGHANGYSEVVHYFGELSSLIM